MTLALVCAGQGGLHAEMFLALAAEPAAAPVLDTLSRLAEHDVLRLHEMWDETRLTRNRLSQLLVVGHALAAHAALAEEGVAAGVCAGYSVGEMAAHACAGAWSASAALELTGRRADCMDRAADKGGPMGLVSLIGLSVDDCEGLAEAKGCAVAIVNGHDHVVVGGPADALSQIETAAPELGARTVRRLPVTVASHTHFLGAAVAPFETVLREAQWQTPDCPVLSGLDGRPVLTGDAMVELLSRQIGERLEWRYCLQSLVEHGATVFLEIGPGRALTRMVEALLPDMPARAYEDFRSAAGAAKWLRRHLPESS